MQLKSPFCRPYRYRGRAPVGRVARPEGPVRDRAIRGRTPGRGNDAARIEAIPLRTSQTSSHAESTPMTSQRKIEANRRNAARSTGPRTPDGKKKVSLNAV